jgi:hypothetical protein
VDDDDAEEEERPHQRPNNNSSDDESGEGSAEENSMEVDGAVGSSADDQLAKKLVRYALSCEYSRTAIRREGIKERGAAEALASLRLVKS